MLESCQNESFHLENLVKLRRSFHENFHPKIWNFENFQKVLSGKGLSTYVPQLSKYLHTYIDLEAVHSECSVVS